MDDKLNNFVHASERYFSLIENFNNNSLQNFLTEIHKTLLLLNLALLDLPETKPNSDEPAYGNFEKQSNLFDKLSQDLNGFDAYRLILGDPLDLSSNDSGNTHLADDLVDIYFDLQASISFLNLDPANNANDVIWQLRFDYNNHWGEHLTNALNVIRHILAEHSDF